MGGEQFHMVEWYVLMKLGVTLSKGLAWHAVVLDATGRMQRSMLLLIIADKKHIQFLC